jgi:diguanylate cyclase (GGDEF)-like protein/PAS domain S-box-containing protein
VSRPADEAATRQALDLLLVEDDADDAALIERHLLREGWEVRIRRVDTADGMADALASTSWDIVISDHSMPTFSAQAALEMVNRAELDLPFIIVSGTIGEERAVAAMRAGASDYIVKDNLGRLGPAIRRELREAGQRHARRRAERALHEVEARTRAIVQAAADGIIATDEDGIVQTVNPAAERMLGLGADEACGRHVDLLLPGVGRLRAGPITGRGGPGLPRETVALGRDGNTFPVEVTRSETSHEERLVITYVVRDVSERKRFEAQLAHRSSHDALTDLPNRSLFHDRLEMALTRAERRGTRTAVLFLDIDHFKVVNDSLGHTAGDRLLIGVAERLQGALRPDDTLARLGGDEFVVLAEGVGTEQEALDLASRLLQSLATPLELAGSEVFVTASIGVAVAAGGGRTPEDVLRDADVAMYRAKERGRARSALFHEGMFEQAMRRLETESALRRGIERDEFRLAYQPIVDLGSGEVTGVEALVRWAHPTRGLLLPHEFIPLAEDTGLINQIGAQVLSQACRQSREWGRRAERPLSISVNLSGRQLATPELVSTVTRTLERCSLDPSMLCLEITESVLMQDIKASIAALTSLRSLGVRLAVDDFGTGYSALSYLKHFPVDQLKIDRSFIVGLEGDSRDAAIVSTILTLADALGLSAVAEGVETEAQEQRLGSLGCRLAQGYRFSRPASAEDIGPVLAGSSGGGRTLR